MKIKITNLGFVYSLLESTPRRDEDPAESWKRAGEDPDLGAVRRIGGVRYDSAELPHPLNFAGLIIKRANDFYSASFLLLARDKRAFSSLYTSNKLEEEIKKTGNEWYPTTYDGTGYILTPENQIAMSIIEMNERRGRDIGLGSNGACPRKFGEQGRFLKEVGELENIATIFVNICLSPLIESGRIKPLPKDLTLHLTL